MERVTQRGKTDCGVACVAMVASVTYDAVRRYMFPKRRRQDDELFTTTGDLKRALEHFGIKTAHRTVPFKDRIIRDLEFDAIIKTKTRKDGKWHWVVYDFENDKILDPKRPPYKRIYRDAYLKVIRP